MLKGETESRSTFVSSRPSGSFADERIAGSASRGRHPRQGHIGLVGPGHMGTAMAATLVAAGHQVTVRRAGWMNELSALGRKPTTDVADLCNCEFVISMLPDDAAVREAVFGRPDLGVDGLALIRVPFICP
jgi:hypothetical protein